MDEKTIRLDVELAGAALEAFEGAHREIDYRRPGTFPKSLTRAQVIEVLARLALKATPTKIRNVFAEMESGK